MTDLPPRSSTGAGRMNDLVIIFSPTGIVTEVRGCKSQNERDFLVETVGRCVEDQGDWAIHYPEEVENLHPAWRRAAVLAAESWRSGVNLCRHCWRHHVSLPDTDGKWWMHGGNHYWRYHDPWHEWFVEVRDDFTWTVAYTSDQPSTGEPLAVYKGQAANLSEAKHAAQMQWNSSMDGLDLV